MSAKKNKKKLPYKRPQLKVIELVADEVLAIGCKSSATGAAFGYAGCVIYRRCYNSGS